MDITYNSLSFTLLRSTKLDIHMGVDKNPLVSIIMPNYNYSKYLDESILSVLNQTYGNIELIVVDDGSTDNSLECIRKYVGRLKLVTQSQSGVAAARNAGLSIAKGEYVCFIDSDDSWQNNKIEKQISIILKSEARVVYSSINVCDSEMKLLAVQEAKYRGSCGKYYRKYPGRAIVLLGCSSALIDSNAILEVGGFNTSLNTSADWDFFQRLSQKFEIEYIEEALVNYRRHSSSMSVASVTTYYEDNEKAVLEMINFLEGNWAFLRKQIVLRKFYFAASSALLRTRNIRPTVRYLLKSLTFYRN